MVRVIRLRVGAVLLVVLVGCGGEGEHGLIVDGFSIVEEEHVRLNSDGGSVRFLLVSPDAGARRTGVEVLGEYRSRLEDKQASIHEVTDEGWVRLSGTLGADGFTVGLAVDLVTEAKFEEVAARSAFLPRIEVSRSRPILVVALE